MPFLALDPDSTAMRFDDSLDDGQSETGATAPRVFRLPETVEEARHVLVGDSGPAVTDPEMDLSISRPCSDDDASARLVNLIALPIRFSKTWKRRSRSAQTSARSSSRSSRNSREADAASSLWASTQSVIDLSRLYVRWFDREDAALHSRHVEKVLDQAVHSDCGTLDRVYRPAKPALPPHRAGGAPPP